MKTKFRTILALTLSIFVCLTVLVSCNINKDTRVKITEAEIQSQLGNDDGTLTVEGSYNDVTSLKYVLAGVNASKLIDRDYTSRAMMELEHSLSLDVDLEVCEAFIATTKVVFLFKDGADDYKREILDIICDGSTKTYGDWKVSATVDVETDSITIFATCK